MGQAASRLSGVHGWELAVIAAAVVGYAVVSGRLAHSPLTPGVVFVTAGLLTGSEVLGWIELEVGSSLVRLPARHGERTRNRAPPAVAGARSVGT